MRLHKSQSYHPNTYMGSLTFVSSHFVRLSLQVIHPPLLFFCLGLVFGGFRIAPGVGWIGTFPSPFFTPRGTDEWWPFNDMIQTTLADSRWCYSRRKDMPGWARGTVDGWSVWRRRRGFVRFFSFVGKTPSGKTAYWSRARVWFTHYSLVKKKWIVGVCACVRAFAFFGTTIRNRFLPFNFAIVQIRTAGRYLLLLEYMTRTSKSSNHRLKLLIYRKAGLPYWRLVTCVWRKSQNFCPLLNM